MEQSLRQERDFSHNPLQYVLSNSTVLTYPLYTNPHSMRDVVNIKPIAFTSWEIS